MKSLKKKNKIVSIVIPVFNEQESVPALYDQLHDVLAMLPYVFEIIFVDDGSRDATLQIIKHISAKDHSVKVISFSRNFGHQAALSAGIDFAKGDALITMDGDLQHPPSLIPTLIEHWKDGKEIVFTIREETADESFLKKLTSRLFYRLINSFSETPIKPYSADFRLLDRKVVNSLKSITERDRFLRGLISWVGFSSVGISYKADARFAGTSKYTFKRMIKLAVNGIISFSAAPLHIVFYVGLIVSFFSFLYGVYSLYAYFFTNLTVPGWTSILVTVLFLGGVQLISIGILGEYLIRVYNESKGRPLYIIKESFGFDLSSPTAR